MEELMKKIFMLLSCFLFVTAFIACGDDSKKSTAGSDASASPSASSSNGGTTATTLFLVGDSTVCEFTDAYYYPRYGYGTQLKNYLNSNVTVNNLALSGRSSKSYITEANYTTLKSSMKSGDYLMIGFGHNDEKFEDARYTNPNTDVSDTRSFKYYLYTYYIKPALDAGATPILCTPIVRRSASDSYTGAVIHDTSSDTSGGTTYPGGDYAKAIRELGATYNVTVIDNTNLTKDLYSTLTASETLYLHAWVSDNSASVDNTHINIYGAKYVAYLIASAIQKSSCSLKSYVLGTIAAPTKAADLVSNASYVPIVYSAPTVKSSTWTTQIDPWWGTVFGDCGGQAKITDGVSFAITANSATEVLIRAGTSSAAVGKVAASTEGIAMYFQKIDASKDFTMTATATVGSFLGSNSQIAFGLMARDAVWIDTFNSSYTSYSVAVGPFATNLGAGAFYSSYMRDAAGLTRGVVSTGTAVPTTGTSIALSIDKTGDNYTLKYGSDAAVVYNVNLKSIDTNYIYVGPYCARQAEVTFSNLSLTIK
jgi:lysophospholipase L1-like esterase